MKYRVKMQAAAASLFAECLGFIEDEAGQDLIEYALVASLLALAAVASMKNIGEKLAASFTGISSSITGSI